MDLDCNNFVSIIGEIEGKTLMDKVIQAYISTALFWNQTLHKYIKANADWQLI